MNKKLNLIERFYQEVFGFLKRLRRFRKGGALLLFTGVVCLLGLVPSVVEAAFPQQINYQGKLTNASNIPLSGSYSIAFTIYDAASGGNNKWTETQTVTTESGFFNVILGSSTPIGTDVFDGNDRWLGIKVGSDSEMTPRQKLTSVGHAFYAYNADKLDGHDWSEVPTGSNYVLKAGDTMTGTLTAPAVTVTPGKLTVLTTPLAGTSTGTLELGISSSGVESLTFNPALGSHGNFVFTAPLQVPSSSPGITFYDPAAPNDQTRWQNIQYQYSSGTAQMAVGKAIQTFYDVSNPKIPATNRTFLLIGTTEVSEFPTGGQGLFLGTNTPAGFEGDLQKFQINGETRFRVDYLGNVVLNNTYAYGGNYPSARLDIKGRPVVGDDSTAKGINVAPEFYSASGTPTFTGVRIAPTLGSGSTGTLYGLVVETGNVGIGTAAPGATLEVSGNVKATKYESTVSTGTAPLTVASTTKVTNLNADLLDGLDSTDFSTTSSDYGRSGVAADLYENTTKLTDKYVKKAGDTMTGTLTMSAASINIASGTSSVPSLSFAAAPTLGFYYPASNYFRAVSGGSICAEFGPGYMAANTIFPTTTTAGLQFYGMASDGATAKASKFGNYWPLTAAGAKIASFYSDQFTTEKAYIDKDGTFSTGGLVRAVSLESTIATGTAPLTVASTTKVANLNADLLDGHEWSEVPSGSNYVLKAGDTMTGTLTNSASVHVSGNVGIGTTAPLDTLQVAGTVSLNAELRFRDSATHYLRSMTNNDMAVLLWNGGADVNVATFRPSGNVGIGTTSPGALLDIAGKATIEADGDITTSAQLKSSVATGTAPLTVASTTKVTNLNADLLDDLDSSAFATTSSLGNYVLKAGDTMTGTLTNTAGANLATSSGNVGIGTTSPGAKLHVYSGGTDYAEFKLESVARTPSVHFRQGANDWYWKVDHTDSKFKITKDSSDLVTIDTSGNIGIGTASPGAKLEVSGNVKATTFESTIATGTAPLTVASTTKVTNLNADLLDDLDSSAFATTSSLGDYVLKAGDTMTGTLTNSASVHVSGNVGIGTAAPGAKLEVNGGTARVKSGSYYLDMGEQYLRNYHGHLYFDNNDVGNNIYFRTSNASALDKTPMTILANGNVGIGTTSPGALLDIAGKATIEADGDITTSAQLKSTVATGTAPLTVASTTKVTNLNADLLDDLDSSAFATTSSLGNYVLKAGDTMTGTLTNTAGANLATSSGNVGIGTTTPSQKLQVQGGDIFIRDTSDPKIGFGHSSDDIWASIYRESSTGKFFIKNDQGLDIILSNGNVGIGTTSPGGLLDIAGKATIEADGDITTSAQLKSTVATGTAPLTVASTTLVTNLNADKLDGHEWSEVPSGSDYVLKAGDTMTGVLTMSATTVHNANGTAAAPSYSFSGDPDTGLYSDSPNVIRFASNGASVGQIAGTQMQIDNIISYTATTMTIKGQMANGATAIGATIGSYNTLSTAGAKLLSVVNNTTEKAYIDKDGTFSTGGLVRAVSLESTVATGTAPLTVASTTKVTNLNADLLDDHDSSYFATAGSLGDYVLKAGDTMTGTLTNTAGANLATSSGNVGIGTASPTQKLDVTGAFRLSSGTIYTPASYLGIYTDASNAQNVKAGSLTISNTYADSAPTNGLYVKGNVGIGATSPGAKLEVSGNVKAITFESTVATGTAPLTVASTTKVTNLNADLLDDLDSSAFATTSSLGNYVLKAGDTMTGTLTSSATTAINASGNAYLATSSGSVGIGTTGVGRKLDIKNAGGVTQTLGLYTNDYVAASAGTSLRFASGAATGNTYYSIQVATAGETAGGNLTLNDGGGNVGIGTTDPTSAKLQISSSTGGLYGIYNLVTPTIAADATQYDIGNYSSARQNVQTGKTNSGYAMGMEAEGYLNGAGNLAATYGLRADSGTTTGGTGTVTNAYGAYIRILNGGGGTISNGYGLFIADIAASNDFGVYQVGSDDYNYFAGNVGIGTNSPGATLEVSGNVKATKYESTVSTGTAPLTVASTTKVTNLNADLLDGLDSTDFSTTSSDYGRSGVATDLYENTTKLTDKYVKKAGDTMTGVLTMSATAVHNANGTAAAPSYTFSSDATKGFYSSGASEISVAIGGAQSAKFIADRIYSNSYFALGAVPVGLYGNVANGATAVGAKIGNVNALSTAGAKIVSFYSDLAATEKAYIDKDGTFSTGGLVRADSLESTVSTGTAPLTVASTTKVTNLNADLLDDHHSTDFATSSDLAGYVQLGPATMQTTTAAVAIYVSGASGIYGIADTSGNGNVGIGGVTYQTLGSGVFGNAFSTSADMHYGGYFQASGEAGVAVYGRARSTSGTNYGVWGETKSSSGYGVYSKGRLGTDSQIVSTLSTGTPPLTVASTTKVDNLNADLLDDHHSTDFAASSDLTNYVLKAGDTMTGTLTNSASVHVSGNVGIGTTSPAAKLDVNGNIYLSGATGTIYGPHIYIRSGAGQPLELGSNDVNSQMVLNDGSVGIGVSPSYKLDVNGTINLPLNTWITAGGINLVKSSYFGYGTGYRITQLGEVGANRGIALGVDLTGNTGGAFSGNEIVIPNNKAMIAPNAANNSYLGVLKVGSDNKVYLGGPSYAVSGTMVLDVANSNVGIGATSPGASLEVAGNVKATKYESTVATGTAPLTVASTTKVTNLNADLLDDHDSSYFATAGSLGDYVLKAGDTMTGTLTIDAVGANLYITNGMVKIGSGDPQKNLDVYGNAVFRANENDEEFVIQDSAVGANALNYDGGNKYLLIDQTNTVGVKVGIGTKTPGNSLDIAGKATIEADGDITTSAQLKSSVATGTAPLTVASTTKVTNLNADLLDDHDSSYFATAGSLGDYVLKAGDTMTGTLTSSALVALDTTGSIAAGNISGGTFATSTGILYTSTSDSLYLKGNKANGATAIGCKIGNLNALSTSGAKIISFYNDNVSTEKAYIDKDGTFSTGGLVRAASLESTVATGTAPLTVASTTKVTNLNADLLDDHDSTYFAPASASGAYVQLGPASQQDSGATYGAWIKGNTYGLHGQGASYGVYGTSDGTNYGYIGGGNIGAFGFGTSYGVHGQTNTASTIGVMGEGLAADSYGVYGSGTAYGVYGINGTKYGYLGGVNYGVYGYYASGGPIGYIGAVDRGVYGASGSSGTYGVYGDTGTTGTYGVYGYSKNAAGYGIYGINASTGYGVYGITGTKYGYLGSASYGGYAEYDSLNKVWLGGSNFGVFGWGTSTAVRGDDDGGNYGYLGGDSYGVYGKGTQGVYGTDSSATRFGYLGSSTYGAYGQYDANTYGILGRNAVGVLGVGQWGVSAEGTSYGVYGHNDSGVYGVLGADAQGAIGIYSATQYGYLGTSSYGVYGRGTNGVYGTDGTSNYGYLGGGGYGAYGQYSATQLGYLGSSNYGAYGQYSSTRYGYLGNSTYGAYGQYDSNNYGILGCVKGSYGVGVYGKAVGTGVSGEGTVTGVWGKGTTAAGVGVYGDYGLDVTRYGYLGDAYYGVFGQYGVSEPMGFIGSVDYGAYGSHNYGTGPYGYMGGASYGAYGNYSATQYGYLGSSAYGAYGRGTTGVYGTDGTRYGYLGSADYGAYAQYSSANFAKIGGSTYGVSCEGSTYGVYGEGGTAGAYFTDTGTASYARLGYGTYGVYGYGTAVGVYGTVPSTASQADIAVYGSQAGAEDGDCGVRGYKASTIYGELGSHRTIGGASRYVSVYGYANSTNTPAIFGEGVANNADSVGVWGYSTYSYGVRGETGNASSYGLYTSVRLKADGQITFPDAYSRVISTRAVYIASDGTIGTTSSSKRYKHDIRDYEIDANKVGKLRPVRFKWNAGLADAGREDIGLIAEDVYKVFPELVYLNDKGQPEGVRYEKVAVVMLKAYQEKQKESQEQKKEIDELKAKLNSLESKLDTVLEKIDGKPSADKGTPISMVTE